MIPNPVTLMARVNTAKVSTAVGTVFDINETSAGGQGVVSFTAAYPVIYYNGGTQPPVRWVHNQKCADGAIFVDDPTGISLFIVELKTTLTPSELKKCAEQFHGGYVNALALAGVLNLGQLQDVQCVVSYVQERLSEVIAANPTLVKILAGRPVNPLLFGWQTGTVAVAELGSCKLHKVQRSPATGVGYLSL